MQPLHAGAALNHHRRAQLHVVHDEIRDKKRLVVDYSGTVNPHTVIDAYPLPLIEPLIERVSQNQIFNSLDLRSAFHQIPLQPSERQLTAFEGDGRLYEWCVLPFAFARVLGELVEGFPGCFHYLDDIVIAGLTEEKHDLNLAKFLELASTVGIHFNSSKSSLKKTSLTFLGHEISQGTMKPSPSRLRPILDYATPSNFKQLERFLGLAVYHSKLVPDFSSLAAPLYVKAEKGPFPLSAICENSIQLIKQAIAASLLVVPDPNKLLRLETDASGTSIAATLLQEGRPVAFFSHRLTPREKAWSAVELEAFAVVAACDELRHFLLGREFEVVVDQQGVSFLFNGKPKSAVKNAKLARWRLQMLYYRFIIVYLPGNLNTVADALSRCSAISSPLANHMLLRSYTSLWATLDPVACRHTCCHTMRYQ